VKTLAELLERGKREPGKLFYGSAGVGSPLYKPERYSAALKSLSLFYASAFTNRIGKRYEIEIACLYVLGRAGTFLFCLYVRLLCL